jgi:enoyl-CoA hydratase/carnithine racemase
MEGQTMEQQASILCEVRNGVGWITLNRPRALNALSVEMIDVLGKTLGEWERDEQVVFVCIQGAGMKGLCAGGDMRAFYDHKQTGEDVDALASAFFSIEYRLNKDMFSYPKPILVYQSGIVMGGGVGISIGASHRVVTELTKWAMPEMNIGFFPDVGGSYFLNQMPGKTGLYLALTSNMITPGDVLYIGAADHFIPSERWESLLTAIRGKEWYADGIAEQLTNLLKEHSTQKPVSALVAVQSQIDHHFSYATMEEIMDSLRNAGDQGDQWAKQTFNTLAEKSPTALKVALAQIQRGSEMSLADCFKMEMNMAMQFMRCDDFYEGVRAVLVDKDRNPQWSPRTLEEVKEETVNDFFDFTWGSEGNPLDDLA